MEQVQDDHSSQEDSEMTISRRLQTTRSLVIAATAGFMLPAAWAAVALDAPIDYAVGQRPAGVAVGDFNGDQVPDLAVTTDTVDKVELMLNDGAGGCTPGPVILVPGGSGPGLLVAGDPDGDTDVDLAVALQSSATVVIVTNTGGAFTVGAQYATGQNPRGITIADMDGDMDLDIAVADRNSNTATVLENLTSPTWRRCCDTTPADRSWPL